MASNGNFSLTISAVDKASGVLANINKQMALSQAPYKRMQRQIQQFDKLSGLKSLRTQTSKLIQPVERAGKAFASIFGLGSIAGVIGMTRQFAMLSNEIQRVSSGLGVSTNKLQQMRGASNLLGTGQNSMEQMTSTIQDNQVAMRFGGNGDLQTIYNKLGLAYTDSADKVRDKVLDYVSEHAKKGDIPASTLRKISQETLGTTAFMGMDSKQVHAAEARAKFLGRYSEDNIKNANQLRQSYEGVLTAVNGVTQTIIGRLAPKLSPLLDKLADWLAGPQADKAIDSLVDGVTSLAGWLSRIDWEGIGNGIKYWYNEIGGFKTIIYGLIGLKLAGWFVAAASTAFNLFSIFKGISKLSLFSKINSLVNLKPGGGLLKFFDGFLGKITKIAGVLGIIKTGFDLYSDSKIKDKTDRDTAYGQTIGEGVGGVAGGILGSAFGPMGTAAGAVAGSYLGGKLGGTVGSYFAGEGHGHEKLSQNDRQQRAATLVGAAMKDGYSRNAAMGIMGNVAQESGFDAGANGDGGNAFGLGQWHRDRVMQILNGTGIDVRKAGYDDQVKAYLWDMKHGDAGAQKARKVLMDNPGISVYGAAQTVSSLDERPADKYGQEANIRTQQAMKYQNDNFDKLIQHTLDMNIAVNGNVPAQVSTSLQTDSKSGLNINKPNINNRTTTAMGPNLH
ncbi:phage tail tip lysozyme [Novacetimonas hansenii]|uniref:Phage tail lysozyme domain-containing protein n=1 Tax=Novacetimonas hansenii TaxID=436 RepID=A0ABQ0SH64_NOVHA|nr:phage tail tip lysozyme [Novacetimonas hansenii]GAN84048.1 hypothetical protein Gaha_0122_048 [Novacetimonas hansenii JCM 7643]GBQ55873.1 hypothetical protein AA0243_1036 [Novacetimonas hansenii NRIC 0243]GEC64573.1 hypothetical protein GHA01_24220 [Novacetimonas hansenii]